MRRPAPAAGTTAQTTEFAKLGLPFPRKEFMVFRKCAAR
jgi:hypothetical protein